MKNFNATHKKILIAGLAGAIFFGQNIFSGTITQAAPRKYSSSDDAAVNVIDYIENARRWARYNRPTKGQQELRRDVQKMKSELREPLSKELQDELTKRRPRKKSKDTEQKQNTKIEERDVIEEAKKNPTETSSQEKSNAKKSSSNENKPSQKTQPTSQNQSKPATAPETKSDEPKQQMPVSFEGEDLFYNQLTGDVYARGHVKITRLDAKRFISEEARGNIITQEVNIPESGQIIQTPLNEVHADLTGYKIIYNHKMQRGTIENATGKLGMYYVKGKRIEIFPTKAVIYDGHQTKCSAHNPDYRVAGDVIEIYPNYDMVVYNAKIYVNKVLIYSQKEYRTNLADEKEEMHIPRVGYSKDDGVWIKDYLSWSFAPRTSVYADIAYYTKIDFKNVYGVNWSNAGNFASVEYGHFEDSDDNWIKKEPQFRYSYSHQLGDLPVNYSIYYERGKWSGYHERNRRRRGVDSMHTQYGLNLSHHPIFLDPSRKWVLSLSGSLYRRLESFNDSSFDAWTGTARLIKTFDRKWVAYTQFEYSKATKENSVFVYGLPDYKNKFSYGVSFAMTPRDRFIAAVETDTSTGSVRDIDYYYFHDFHCMQAIVRYRYKRDLVRFDFEFNPW